MPSFRFNDLPSLESDKYSMDGFLVPFVYFLIPSYFKRNIKNLKIDVKLLTQFQIWRFDLQKSVKFHFTAKNENKKVGIYFSLKDVWAEKG